MKFDELLIHALNGLNSGSHRNGFLDDSFGKDANIVECIHLEFDANKKDAVLWMTFQKRNSNILSDTPWTQYNEILHVWALLYLSVNHRRYSLASSIRHESIDRWVHCCEGSGFI